MPMPWSKRFLARAAAAHVDPAQFASAADLEATLQALLDTARARWPGFADAVPDEDFLDYLADRLPTDGDVVAALSATHAADVYLACACVRAHAPALQAFDQHFISAVSSYLSRGDALPGIADEIKQTLRERLLMTEGRPLPRIANYSGRGPLGAWLRVIAAREALLLHASAKPDAAGIEPPLDLAAPSDPELTFLKTHYKDDLRAAFESTLAALAPREGAILRLYYLEGMTAQSIGALYDASARTVQRWIVDMRERILAETHRRLGERLDLPKAELGSLVGLLQSQLEVSIWRFLEHTPSVSDPAPGR